MEGTGGTVVEIAKTPGNPAKSAAADPPRPAVRRRPHLPGHLPGRRPRRPRGLPAQGAAPLRARRLQLRSHRHQARPPRQGGVRAAARVLRRPAGQGAAARPARDARGARHARAGDVHLQRLLTVLPPAARSIHEHDQRPARPPIPPNPNPAPSAPQCHWHDHCERAARRRGQPAPGRQHPREPGRRSSKPPASEHSTTRAARTRAQSCRTWPRSRSPNCATRPRCSCWVARRASRSSSSSRTRSASPPGCCSCRTPTTATSTSTWKATRSTATTGSSTCSASGTGSAARPLRLQAVLGARPRAGKARVRILHGLARGRAWRSTASMHVYHYAAYEDTALKKLAGRHATREALLDTAAARKAAGGPVQGHARIDPRLDARRTRSRTSRRSTAASAAATCRPPAPASSTTSATWRPATRTLLEKIERYNQDDVESTQQLHDWLWSMRPDDILYRGGTDDTERGAGSLPPLQPAIAEAAGVPRPGRCSAQRAARDGRSAARRG